MDNLLILEDVLSKDECDNLIKSNTDLIVEDLHSYHNYEFKDLDEWYNDELFVRITDKIIEDYKIKFPSINMTPFAWHLTSWRFKHFPKDHAFNAWHCEHSGRNPFRIACILVYLSDHDCGTEFYANGEVVKSKAGRAIIFPAAWTHMHRGQYCPEKKDRYIMSAYIDYDFTGHG